MDTENREKPISREKIEANRRNALKSTGPRTPEGKRNSSRNATTHGMLSGDLVIRSGEGKESIEEFEQLLGELIEEHQPQTRTELSLVETIAICDWRYRRSLRAEAGEIMNGFAPQPMYDPSLVLSDRSLPARTHIFEVQAAGELKGS